ncbi:MAG: mechanosensitive ion channel family protein, partial [Desulforhopalus sp.]|nr:mechanosensitive ion channel family protein [Desulforhopalus sp.]
MKTTGVLPTILLLLSLITVPLVCHAGEGLAEPDGPPGEQSAQMGADRSGSLAPLPVAQPESDRRRPLVRWLRMLDRSDGFEEGGQQGVLAFAPHVPGDLARVFRGKEGEDLPGFWGVLWRTGLSLALALLLVVALSRLARERINQLRRLTPPDGQQFAVVGVALLRSIPTLVGVVLLLLVSIGIFLLIAGNTTSEGRMLFQTILGIVLAVKICGIAGEILFAPEAPEVRFWEIAEELVKPLFRVFVVSTSLLLSGLLITNLARELGVLPQTLSWVSMTVGSLVLAVYAYLVVFLRQPLTNALLANIDSGEGSWFQQQLARAWHIPALLYLLVVWLVWLGQEITGTFSRNGALIISMVIIPLYFALSYWGKVLITLIVESLGLAGPPSSGAAPGDEDDVKALAKRDSIIARICLIYRLVVAGALLTWVISLWGYHLPYAGHAVKALFETLVTLALALLCWRFASAYIEKKINELASEVECVGKDEDDDEFGGAAQRGRSHTLLPMLRKFIGTVLVVMVALIVISSLGVNIGPLLAGAGVVGLAVGFGAQKLVCDVLSGFFLLLDDAFRVGEYIQAGSIRGTVEAITLRNVMLRHHLGMLQIVPYSDLGAITNYMRGGIVMKFPLEFSYDTDIDKVRKIIKQVGIQMLEDPELRDGFIQPLKSQGVNEITNSVMVIRVKFTAKPGKQFLIKREAFRRITEALSARGIHYAHRKVIVDFPEDERRGNVAPETERRLLEGAAAAVITENSTEQAAKKPVDKIDDFS